MCVYGGGGGGGGGVRGARASIITVSLYNIDVCVINQSVFYFMSLHSEVMLDRPSSPPPPPTLKKKKKKKVEEEKNAIEHVFI